MVCAVRLIYEGPPNTALDEVRDVTFQQQGEMLVSADNLGWDLPRGSTGHWCITHIEVTGPDGVVRRAAFDGGPIHLSPGATFHVPTGHITQPQRDMAAGARAAFLSGNIDIDEFERRLHRAWSEVPYE